jgi:hypothetical protein
MGASPVSPAWVRSLVIVDIVSPSSCLRQAIATVVGGQYREHYSGPRDPGRKAPFDSTAQTKIARPPSISISFWLFWLLTGDSNLAPRRRSAE